MKKTSTIRRSFTLVVAAAFLAGAPPARPEPAPLPLSELLGNTGGALVVLEAEAEAAAAGHEVERERAEQGLRVNLGGGYGLVRNIVDTNLAYTYSAAQATAGFSYPLLGASETADRKVDAAVGTQREKDIRLDAARLMAQLQIESNYASYWGAQESLKVVQAYLDSESLVLPKLELRVRNKLMLQSDQLDAETSYAQAKGDVVRFKRIEDDARNRLQRLCGRQLGDFAARPVQLPQTQAVDAARLVQRHPDIAALHAQEAALQAQLHDTAWYGFEASLDVNGSGVRDTSQGGPAGGTAFVGLNIKAPIGVFSAASEERKRLRAEIEDVRLHIQDRSQELAGEYQAALEQLVQQQQEGEQMSRRVQAGSEGLRETYLRGGTFAEEGVDVLARRLQSYYKSALEEVDARVKGWQSNVYLRSYAAAGASAAAPTRDLNADTLGTQLADPIVQVNRMLQGHAAVIPPAAPYAPGRSAAWGPSPQPAGAPADSAASVHLQPATYTVPADAPASVPAVLYGESRPALQRVSVSAVAAVTAPAVAAQGAAPGLAVYVWNSGELIAAQDNDKLWQGLRNIPVDRLLLSLNAQQVEQAGTQPQQLQGFLASAKRHGVKVELLLGDPGWIEPGQRPKLVAIIHALRGFDFAALNLDIEPDQAYKQLDPQHFDAWMETLRAAAQASPWPTGVSIHPRYFRDPPYAGWHVADRLRQSGISEVVLMIYSSDPQRVADIANAIAANAGSLRFRVAQSVEPELEPALSYAGRSPRDFAQAMQRLQGLLAVQQNTDGVVVQAWNDLLRMGYESQVR